MAARRISGDFSPRAAASTRALSPEVMKACSTAFLTSVSVVEA